AGIKSLVLDAGPLLTQSYNAIQHLADAFYTTPSVYNEIRDEKARQNLLLWGDRLEVRQPKPEYIKAVTDFSKKTGDYAVLSSTDLHIIALCYEIECDLNNGDWRLRKFPGQKHINGANPSRPAEEQERLKQELDQKEEDAKLRAVEAQNKKSTKAETTLTEVTKTIQQVTVEDSQATEEQTEQKSTEEVEDDQAVIVETEDMDSDEEGGEWITASNIQEKIEKDGGETLERSPTQRVIKAAMSTGDFAMQNVALQIGLNLVNPTNGLQIKKVKNFMLRCHACFHIMPIPKDGKPHHFCPRCGSATLLRCTVTTTAAGKIQVHLKKNMQWSHRGDKFSMGTPQSKKSQKNFNRHGDNVVLLREDQKEYQKAVKNDMWKRQQNEKVLDEWIGGSADGVMTPFSVSGMKRDATKHTGVKIGMGRFINSKRRS
ncbi:D-site 20S pre-rRNA nuclease, partial [Nadsonia fulvescens var. elongata DSM 6958]